MTDKEIIINGIDVTECTYRRQKPHNFCMCASVINESGNIIELTRYVQCEYNPNCYFKQRARAKGEIAELTSIINKSAERFANDYLETFKENEKLKIQLMQKSEVDTFFNTPIEGWDNDPCKICQYKQDYQAKEQECEHWKNQCLCLDDEYVTVQIPQEQFEEYHQYKQALDEIEKLAKENVELLEGYHLEQANCLTILEIINQAKAVSNAR